MSKIIVFDSGLGSLSIIKEIQKNTKTNIIYFADQKNYPYGQKNIKELRQIIEFTIASLKKKFNPDIIVVGSNTPTILFPDLFTTKTIVGVLPPVSEAAKKSKTKSIALLGTKATITSGQLDDYVANNVSENVLITKIDATDLIDLVETGKFVSDKNFCKKKIKNILSDVFTTKQIDVVTLSSTHLPFLDSLLKELFPEILFLDPALQVANQIIKNKRFQESKKNSLQIYCSGSIKSLENNLYKLKIKNKIHSLQF